MGLLGQIDQFRYIKIQSQTIDLRTRLWGIINPTNSVFIPQMSLMAKLVIIDNQNHAALTSQSLLATIGPLKDNWPLFHYVTRISGILPYKRILPYKHVSRSLDIFFAYTVLSHGSIILPPRQPRVLARLGSLAIINRPVSQIKGILRIKKIKC